MQSDLKAIKGIWDWVVGFFVTKPDEIKPVAQAKAATKQTYQQLELNLIKSVGDNLGLLFDTQQQINNHYLELEEESKSNYNPEQNTSKKAVERVLITIQLEKLMEQTREAMIYAPPELKDLYSRFLVMHNKIEQEQQWARSEMVRRIRLLRWQKEQEEIRAIELTSGVIAVVFVSSLFGWLMWQLRVLSGGF